MKTILVATPIDIDSFMDSLIDQLTFDEIIELVKRMDAACQDWGVTAQLHEHFKGVMVDCPEDDK